MSKRVHSLTVCLVALALLMSAVGPVAARATQAPFTLYETYVSSPSLGTEFFPDGRYHVRGAEDIWAWQATDPRLDGAQNLVTLNWNFKWMPEPVFVSGQMWGTFVSTHAGGYWEGTWTGVREENGFSYFHYVGTGGGGYEGLQLRMWGERLDPDPYAIPTTLTGYILDPGG